MIWRIHNNSGVLRTLVEDAEKTSLVVLFLTSLVTSRIWKFSCNALPCVTFQPGLLYCEKFFYQILFMAKDTLAEKRNDCNTCVLPKVNDEYRWVIKLPGYLSGLPSLSLTLCLSLLCCIYLSVSICSFFRASPNWVIESFWWNQYYIF